MDKSFCICGNKTLNKAKSKQTIAHNSIFSLTGGMIKNLGQVGRNKNKNIMHFRKNSSNF